VDEDIRERWRGPIANADLTSDLLPASDAPWSEINLFASTLNGYEVHGPSPHELMDFAGPVRQRFEASGELPDDLTDLRVTLFAEQRRDHFSDSSSQPETMRYVHAIVEAIRRAVAQGDGA
jgi:hypothetical protein